MQGSDADRVTSTLEPVTRELERLHANLDGLVSDALTGDGLGAGPRELLESVRATLDDLRAAERELERRSGELAAAREAAEEERRLWILRVETAPLEAAIELLKDELDARVDERTRELSAVIEHLPLGVAVLEAASGRVLRHNRRAAELLGVPGGEVRSLASYVAEARIPGRPPLAAEEWPSWRAFGGETVIGERVLVRTTDGKEHVFEFSAAPVTGPGRRVGSAVVVFQDVADRERRERAIRTFVTNAAHELATPLAGIIAAVEALQGGAKDDEANRDRFLDHVERESARLERLMRALLVLARVQGRAEPADLTVIPLESLLADVASGVAPGPGVRIETSCAGDVAALANRPLLEQALMNLAGNAARHTQRGAIRLSAIRDGDEVQVVVGDTGPGIPAEVQERLFERFVRGEGGTGFGLGLAIARDSIEATGGSLTIASSGEAGTRAVVRLPGARLVEDA